MSDAPDDAGPTGVTFTLDGREITADPGELVIAAAERHGVYIPRFCWHPRMSPVGMCRMCICEVDTGRGPALQPTCMIEVSDGMNVDTASPTTKKAQDGILEFLLINHPLDCPVCDKGGECPLQDQTLAFGPGETRFVEEKRHFRKPIPISDLVLLDRERCILCDRCTRFASEVAGDPLISFVERGNETQVLTFPDEPFNSYFSGNTVQLCPVGALTARPYRFRARPWDLDQVESTCTTCAVGCRVTIESTRNEVTRYLGVDVDAVNHGWLCDRGRFDYEAIMSDDRLTVPLRRDPDDADLLVETSWHDALAAAAAGLRGAGSGGAVAVLGGARLTNEDASAWARLAAEALDTPHVDCQLDDGLPADLLRSLPMATIDEACASTLLWLGADPKEELPVLYLRLRGAVEAGTLTLIEAGPLATSLTPLAKRSERVRPGELPAAVTGLLDDLGDGPLVVAVGRASLADSVDPLAEAIGVVRGRRPDATFLPLLRRGNVRGAIDAGLTPGEGGLDCRGVLELAAAGGVGALVLLGADPLNDVPDRDLVRRAMDRIGFVVSIDTLPSDSTLRADVVLPAAAYAERSGTTTNLEGPGHRPRPEGHAARHGPPRLDDRRRAGPRPRHRPRRRLPRRPPAPRAGGGAGRLARGHRVSSRRSRLDRPRPGGHPARRLLLVLARGRPRAVRRGRGGAVVTGHGRPGPGWPGAAQPHRRRPPGRGRRGAGERAVGAGPGHRPRRRRRPRAPRRGRHPVPPARRRRRGAARRRRPGHRRPDRDDPEREHRRWRWVTRCSSTGSTGSTSS